MSGDTSAFGFGKFIPGFDFLQGLAQGAGTAANPLGRVPQWVAPTVSVEEVDKRIAELKAVQFWLDQNGRALSATIQALEVQRMTLATLNSMNVQLADLQDAMTIRMPKHDEAAGDDDAADDEVDDDDDRHDRDDAAADHSPAQRDNRAIAVQTGPD